MKETTPPEAGSELGLWRVSFVVQFRALDACEEALAPVFGIPGHESNDWIAGLQAVSTIPLDPDAEPKPENLWRLEALCADLPVENDIEQALSPVANAFGIEIPDVTIEVVDEIDWVATALISHPPVRSGRFYVHGRHVPSLHRGRAIDLNIEAGRAFGTGNHQSTRGCLQAIDALAKRRRYRRLLDVGSGSGILSMAMAKRWRVPVLGIDIDPVAAELATEYSQLNGLAGLTRFIAGDGFGHREIRSRGPFDLITANILARPLKRMAPDMRRMLKPGGRIILAGLLDRHENLVLSAYRAQGIRLERRIRLQEWTTLVLAGEARTRVVSIQSCWLLATGDGVFYHAALEADIGQHAVIQLH